LKNDIKKTVLLSSSEYSKTSYWTLSFFIFYYYKFYVPWSNSDY
jgi:hypothetical protein